VTEKLKWFRIHFQCKRHIGDTSLPAKDIEDADRRFKKAFPWMVSGLNMCVIEEIRD
jgi:hypothetical protein